MKNKKGFTLVEMLVVIAIIAILAGFIFPVFARARAKARQAVCLSNVKQLGLACLMYAGDWDEMLPTGRIFTGVKLADDHPEQFAWPNQIYSYVKDKNLFHCPSDPNGNLAFSYLGNVGNACGQDYYAWALGAITCKGQSLAGIEAPSELIMLGCAPFNAKSNPWEGSVYRFAYIDAPRSYPTANPADTRPGNVFNMSLGVNSSGVCFCSQNLLCYLNGSGPQYDKSLNRIVHNEGTTFAFVDGHAKWLKVEQTITPHNLWTKTASD